MSRGFRGGGGFEGKVKVQCAKERDRSLVGLAWCLGCVAWEQGIMARLEGLEGCVQGLCYEGNGEPLRV